MRSGGWIPLPSHHRCRHGEGRGGRGRRVKWQGATLSLVTVVALLLGSTASAETSMLDPRGPRAERVADLWWIMFVLGAIVFFVVMAFLLVAIRRARRQSDSSNETDEASTTPIKIGVAITTAIVLLLVGLTFWAQRDLAAPDDPAAMTIEVVGHQYWWEVYYPDAGFMTANEIHIPVGEPVSVRLSADDVIHSFWVPELSGKLDLVPGRVNEFWIQADESGVYLGECAEYCGLQHALMQFRVVADPPDVFAAWIDHQSQPAPPSTDPMIQRGEQIFLGSACVYCHAVRGTAALSDFGPDLTHLASRETLAAGTLDNNRANLAVWIVDPQSVKVGNLMPGIDISDEDLDALLTYLESLE